MTELKRGCRLLACAAALALLLCACNAQPADAGPNTPQDLATGPLLTQTPLPSASPSAAPTQTGGPERVLSNVYASGTLSPERAYAGAGGAYTVMLPVQACVTLLGGEMLVIQEDSATVYTINFDGASAQVTLRDGVLSYDGGDYALTLENGVLYAESAFLNDALDIQTSRNAVGDIYVDPQPEPTQTPDGSDQTPGPDQSPGFSAVP